MPRLAIVISAVGSTELLEGTLLSVLENRPADSEIIVTSNQAYPDPYDLKDEVRFVQPVRRTTLVGLVRHAMIVTRAPFVHLLASGCEVTEGWADEALARFGDRRVGSVAPVVFDAQRRDRIFAVGVGYRPGGKRFLVGQGLAELTPDAQSAIVGPGSFAAFYRKAALDFVGGPSSQLGARQSDVDLALVLACAGFDVAAATQSRVFASEQVEPHESAAREALYDERLFWRNLPDNGWAKALLAHAGLVSLELLTSLGRPRMLTQLAARTWACAQIGNYVRHRHALAQLKQRAVLPKAHQEHLRIDRSHSVPSHSDTAKVRARAG